MPDLQFATPDFVRKLIANIKPATTLWFCLTHEEQVAENPYISKVIKKGEKYGFLPTPVRKGYDFLGWKVDDVDITSETVFNGDAEQFAVAQWDKKVWLASFNANGGTGTMESEEVSFGEALTLPECGFTKVGYRFEGWIANDEMFDVGVEYESETDIEFSASWLANEYSIKFNANGGEGVMDDQAFIYDESQALNENEFEKTGYTFTGWAKTASGTKEFDDKAIVSNLATEHGAEVNLFAKWNANQYYVRFNSGSIDVTGSMSDQTFVYDVEQALNKNTFERDGFTFEGWADSNAEGAEKVYDDQANVKNLATGGFFDLYPVWKALGPDVIYGYYVNKSIAKPIVRADLPETCYANKLPTELFEGESTETDEYEISLTKVDKVGDMGTPLFDYPKYSTVFVLVKSSTNYKAQADWGLGTWGTFVGVNEMFDVFAIDGTESLTIGGEVYDVYSFWNDVSNGTPLRVISK